MDTLRDESCPICGEQDAWDGDQCRVCGFIQPPKQFQDPDVDKAKQLDLRRDKSDVAGGDIPGMEDATQDRDRDGINDDTGEPMDEQESGLDDAQPMLVCPACGEQFEAGHPASTSTTDPQMGDDAETDGPAEGDVCPACGKGLLETPDEVQAEDAEMADEEQDPDADPDDPDADPDADPMDPDDPDQMPDDDHSDHSNPFADDDEQETDDDVDPDDDDSDDDADDDADDDTFPAKKKLPPGKK